MKKAVANIESTGMANMSSVSHNLSRVKMWVSGFAATGSADTRKGRRMPQVFVNTRAGIGRLEITFSTSALSEV